MSAVDTDRFRDLLLEERGRVVAAMEHLQEMNRGSLTEEAGEIVSGSADDHMGDLATATFDREMDYTLEGNAEIVLNAIDAALGRIEQGTYGRCRICGRDIGEERLEARPWTDLCIDDQRREERYG
jgi:RNA polymerase-binding protein DksA